MGVVVRRYIDFLIILLIQFFFAAAFLLLCSLTLGALCAARVILVVLCVCMCVCMYVCPLVTAATHIEITKQRYQRVHSNTAIV